MSAKLSVYERIMKAAEKGVGIRLSAQDCEEMSMDDAIATAAFNFELLRKGQKLDDYGDIIDEAI
ncbi:hypothetical protein CcrC1_gp399 [Caulobacter phage C1]|nr:hypothetical protein CcrC1_gp399 [Caulobacter phage C1]UTU08628.1 hypothetical protein CcrC2_gp400 [Caulobacter phage C2]UTU09143.1 hypothetical protein CcrJ4_gp394 [Caulobacter phage J4]UTU10260.1 hypothetical protein CcrRB23_gp398 [Caulobacter phage RB23]WGN97294.1 hypothetical protein [Bertelyvirus sp.]